MTGTDNRCASHRSGPTCATVPRLLAPSDEVGGQMFMGAYHPRLRCCCAYASYLEEVQLLRRS